MANDERRRPKGRRREAVLVAELTAEELKAIAEAEIPPEAATLDELMS